MRLLAFDQAMHKTGYAVFEDGKVVRHGTLEVSHKFTGTNCILCMTDEIVGTVQVVKPDVVAIEQVHHRRNTKTLIQLAQLMGAVLALLEYLHSETGRPGQCLEVSSAEVMKYLHLTPGTTRERKKHRARWVATEALGRDANMLGDDELIGEDEADAIIIGLVALKKLGIDTLDNQDYTDNSVK